MKILGNVPVKPPFWSPLFKYICMHSMCERPLAFKGSCPF